MLRDRLGAWMMVSRTGEITMLGPVQLLPYDKHQHDPRISFRRAGGTQWDMVVRSDELCRPEFLLISLGGQKRMSNDSNV